jgi:threonine aldolase
MTDGLPDVELRSDTFTLPTDEMLEAIRRAELGDDVYGEDPTVRLLEETAAEMVGKAAACLMPSGTMANLASLLAHCPRGSAVLAGDRSDIVVYEAGGASVCGGLVYRPVVTQPDGELSLPALTAAMPEASADPQFAPGGLLCLESTHNLCGGAVLSLDYLRRARAWALERGLPVHLDGARLFNAAVALDVAPAEVARSADSVQLCLSKGLSAPIGSMVAGTSSFVERVRRARKMLGGGMRQAGIVAAAGLVALRRMTGRLREDHRRAAELATGIAAIPGLRVDQVATPTNIVIFRLDAGGPTAERFIARCRERGVRLGTAGPGRVRAVTHRGVGDGDVARALEVARAVAGDA